MVTPYTPDTGHIVWLSLDPKLGHEQSGRRPFLVLSPRTYNQKTSLAVGVPITSHRKGYPFEVALAVGSAIGGVALADQIKSLDWHARHAEFVEEAAPSTLRAIRERLATFLQIDVT